MNPKWLDDVVAVLVSANATVPVIVESIAAITAIVKLATGSGPSVTERAAIIRAQVANNAAYGEAELARLDALIENAGA